MNIFNYIALAFAALSAVQQILLFTKDHQPLSTVLLKSIIDPLLFTLAQTVPAAKVTPDLETKILDAIVAAVNEHNGTPAAPTAV
jgi:hypothetical protein